MNASFVPSGEYKGRDSSAGSDTSKCASPPVDATVHRSLPLTNAISFPSGDIAGCDNDGRDAGVFCALARKGSERNGSTTATARSETRTENLNDRDVSTDELTLTEDSLPRRCGISLDEQ